MNINLSINDIDALVFDFDGVLTDNLVYLDSKGNEIVCCSRSDGLAFDILRKLEKPSYILSTEKNPVVSARAKKLKIEAIQGVLNKADAINELAKKHNFNLKRILFVGNDLNDLAAMELCGYRACPSDSHMEIKKLSDIVLESPGGKGVVRELLENSFNIDFKAYLS